MSDLLTTIELDHRLDVTDTLRRFQNCPFVMLLDSAGHIRKRDARYTFLTADPVDTVRIDQVSHGDEPFVTLRDWQSRLPQLPHESASFCGGIAGMMSYELGHAFETLPSPQRDEFGTPALLAGLFDWAIVWDHVESRVSLHVLKLDGSDQTAPAARVAWALQKLGTEPQSPAKPHAEIHAVGDGILEARTSTSGFSLPSAPAVKSCFAKDDYITAVERVIEYIRAGDIFQANLSQQLTALWSGTAVELYDRVRQQNPAPFCGLLQADDVAVVSASPERFLKVTGGEFVETRPIKGTRRRHRSPIADLYASSELYASEKDRAENVMIVDLLRNDLSRVCRAGSVKVTGLCEIEVFETVQHLVSTVVGRLQPHRDVWDLCAATIPGGSITGAPKIRAMEIIAELEPTVRGAYCGNFFCLGPNGNFDSSILIRTFTLKNGVVQFPVGGGIVADSVPHDEYEETMHKAAGMLRALNADEAKGEGGSRESKFT
ncbi:aminodeoxychorismate synthase component I [Fuerstiella marisgermanici]|uniref:aminodeoxychorismate synthase n=1 Tax=Fuerstiella marisgermanici TaxID=1891926 RepID=A0A1P8WNN4_9PLAN|nr:aminodeoxychorismate synthase component I [Fuerstiella marisgermanici]APZ95661.1 Para-aminobenzoate synthase component 1 [Fuerstiella marisgermanici]